MAASGGKWHTTRKGVRFFQRAGESRQKAYARKLKRMREAMRS
jgi:hypothetical protein